MLLWFAVLAPVLVAEVFRSPMVDYRVVALGALLPLVEASFGRSAVLHTLAGSVLALGLTMVVTIGRRLRRRRWLGIPIGLFLHLVLDGTWARSAVFWWPAFGWSLGDDAAAELDRSPVAVLALEAVAVAVGVWAWRRYELGETANRERLLRTGHLGRTVLG